MKFYEILKIDTSRKFYLQLTPLNELKVLYEDDYEDTYNLLNDGVGGLIEHFTYFKSLYHLGIDTWCNDEGRSLCLDPSIVICDGQSKRPNVISSILGNIVFSRCDSEGNTLPLNIDDVDVIANMFLHGKGDYDNMDMGYFVIGNKIRILPILFYQNW